MSLNNKQDEWSNLVLNDDVSKKFIDISPDLFGKLSHEDKITLSSIWLIDGIHARHIDFPKDTTQLNYLRIIRSPKYRILYNSIVVAQILFPFFEERQCNGSSNNNLSLFFVNNSPTRLFLTILDLIVLVFYFFDLKMTLGINPSFNKLKRKPWTTFRLVGCVFIFIDCLLFFAFPNDQRIFRCLFPFFLISKRSNLKLMFQGLLTSSINSMPIIKFLFSVLVFWGFLGYIMFRNLGTDDPERFSDPFAGFGTALHCFTSRPYTLKALNPLYAKSELTTVYFLTLTIAADLMCLNFILGIGKRYYKNFVTTIWKKRLSDQRNAIGCAFLALSTPIPSIETDDNLKMAQQIPITNLLSVANENREVTRASWLSLCKSLDNSKYKMSEYTANFIFDMVLSGDPRIPNQLSIEKLLDNEEMNFEEEQAMFTQRYALDEYLFFRACSLVSMRLKVYGKDLVEENSDTLFRSSGISMSKNLDRKSLSELIKKEEMDEEYRSSVDDNQGKDENPDEKMSLVFSPAIDNHVVEGVNQDDLSWEEPRGISMHQFKPSLTTSTRSPSILHPRKSNSHPVDKMSFANRSTLGGDLPRQTTLRGSVNMSVVDVDVYLDRKSLARPSKLKFLHFEERDSQGTNALGVQYNASKLPRRYTDSLKQFQVGKFLFDQYKILKKKSNFIRDATLSIEFNGKSRQVPILYSLYIMTNLLLLLSISFLSNSRKDNSWLIFSWVLEILLWSYMALNMFALGFSKFFAHFEYLLALALGLSSLVTLSLLTHFYTQSSFDDYLSSYMLVYLFIQCLRLGKFVFLANDIRIFEHIYPIFFRACLIYFSVLYFFSVLSYQYFCDSLNPEDASNASSNNDAGLWVQFQNILNFKTFLQSMYTLFEMSILGNWSMVMDTAALSSNKYSAFFFFYLYRLTVTLFVLPILISFVLHAFIAAIASKHSRREQKKLLQTKTETEKADVGDAEQAGSSIDDDDGGNDEDINSEGNQDQNNSNDFRQRNESNTSSHTDASIHSSNDSRFPRPSTSSKMEKNNSGRLLNKMPSLKIHSNNPKNLTNKTQKESVKGPSTKDGKDSTVQVEFNSKSSTMVSLWSSALENVGTTPHTPPKTPKSSASVPSRSIDSKSSSVEFGHIHRSYSSKLNQESIVSQTTGQVAEPSLNPLHGTSLRDETKDSIILRLEQEIQRLQSQLDASK